MSANSSIEWTDHTFNPWWGCAKVSPACDHCYAERDAKRYQPGRVLWGVGAERRTFGDKHWAEPEKWNRRAAERGVRERVFCASMADVFDNDAPEGQRDRLWQLITATPALDWLLLTKRIGNARRMMPVNFGGFHLHNVWLGATVINQEEAARDIPKLLATPARIRFLSIEPMLGPINLHRMIVDEQGRRAIGAQRGIDWVIAGGESGPHARPAHPDWFRSLRDQCTAAGVPFLLKQHGEWIGCETEASCEVFGTACYPDDGYGVELEDGRRYQVTRAHGGEFVRVGKKAAGRLLDGWTHDGIPS